MINNFFMPLLLSISAFIFTGLLPVIAQDPGNLLLKDIAQNLAQYKGSTLTLTLRLRNYDTVFEKIIFYDKKNHDIEFDISANQKKKKLRRAMLTLHEGLEYRVTFIVNDRDSLGRVLGDLSGFTPVFLEKLPERK